MNKMCPGFPPKSSSSAATWWWESVNLLGNSPKGGGIDENKVSLGAVSNEPRCTCCFSSQIHNLCLSTDNIRRKDDYRDTKIEYWCLIPFCYEGLPSYLRY